MPILARPYTRKLMGAVPAAPGKERTMGRTSSKPTVVLPVPRIREWRVARGLTQESLAARSGASYFTVQRIEQLPHRRPHPATLRKLAKGLEVPTSRLYFPPEVSGGAGKPG